ncbi:type II toxin-antitoxin system death-on-curing family toxin [Labrenzia sp. R4_1]|uniref:type II toxin-antitoxin system death-on-curing family toxin n=1 Tax=unclassified Labrenzia TaxID=2648686 RepID=UPI001AD9F54B|nr:MULTISPECIES: type II toxin-antitoxin system death-on-curing family toxin [unclassified Labrenzia]MBO9417893.1 type II toxin-antitoxin system death-on-curing family toxin [Labrenzia sp. R4_2]MBO9423881.1 type II toxin-antitoxin system death-on-curing family toxin [Labrenzia sp. R4_1]
MAEPTWLTFGQVTEIIDVVGELYPRHRVELVRPDDLAAALERPVNRFHYAGETSLFMLAAEYIYGIGKAHALVDGNKRIAFQSALVFLELNRVRLNEPADEFFAVYIKALMADRINMQMLSTVFSVFSEPM